ncbi:hypothetical protein FIBSPDRAFT_343372 [Athelia psychrophila]|uniref:Uncharacterized protein n=1 Tax=Athelia psychrophila TaxID=1759441 RepID=A0A167W607_9AGAM|nr:hypothetical protein FIBSPDRAFT_343372 [Fibularhizoctonia sp. CBS 109695]
MLQHRPSSIAGFGTSCDEGHLVGLATVSPGDSTSPSTRLKHPSEHEPFGPQRWFTAAKPEETSVQLQRKIFLVQDCGRVTDNRCDFVRGSYEAEPRCACTRSPTRRMAYRPTCWTRAGPCSTNDLEVEDGD